MKKTEPKIKKIKPAKGYAVLIDGEITNAYAGITRSKAILQGLYGRENVIDCVITPVKKCAR